MSAFGPNWSETPLARAPSLLFFDAEMHEEIQFLLVAANTDKNIGVLGDPSPQLTTKDLGRSDLVYVQRQNLVARLDSVLGEPTVGLDLLDSGKAVLGRLDDDADV